MKRTHLLMLLLVMCFVTLPLSAQNERISMTFSNERLSSALRRLEKVSNFKISFAYRDVEPYTVSGDLKNATLESALRFLLADKPLAYTIKGRMVDIRRAARTGRQPVGSAAREITGTVKDETGEPLPGATVTCVLHQQNHEVSTAVTDMNGHFRLLVSPSATHLTVTFIGFKAETVALTDAASYAIVLSPDAKSIGEVVVNGMFTRRAESYTGSTSTFSQSELQSVGNQNILRSLANLDPSFQIVENLDLGSDPNSMPNYQMRGATSFNLQGDYDGNANQPLFILDGFETTLEKIKDLDMNRVSSVTLLKDAAAKAIYGSKAGNGVVVIETERPKSGKIRITYNGNLNIQTPDLSGYNLMNAQEKFDWENAHKKYTEGQASINPMAADLLYKEVYDAIASGVDTYWLKIPLRTGVGQKHTVSLEGGDSKIRYILGAYYNDIAGTMKGSGRTVFNVNSTLSYTYKNMVFRNMMDFTQNLSKNSPYGSFSDYVSLEPYYAPYDADGNVKEILGYEAVLLDGSFGYPVYNPLYNASLNSKNESRYIEFQDNFDMDWHINEHFRFTAKLSYTRQDNQSDLFYPANHTMFVDYDANGMSNRKGLYSKTDGYLTTLILQSGLNWNRTFGKHSFFFNGTYSLQTQSITSSTTAAEGFGNGVQGDISMATSYYHDSHPTGSDNKTREIGLIGSFNYSYADRYLIDASYRATGSSVYGSDNHWGNFWSLGAGWNIHKEKWLAGNELIKQLKLRYSLGYTGTQNFNPYQARARYQYGTIFYDGRMGATLMAMPNTGLQWQKIYDNNIGLDLALGKFLIGKFEYYVQNTNNMLTDITIPSSSGFTTYKANMGEIQNKGWEVDLSFTPWRNNKTRSWVTLSASAMHNKNTIRKIYDIFDKINSDADAALNSSLSSGEPSSKEASAYRANTTRPATKFYEGCSMTAIWGMRSLGIDPMSGNEMYLDKNNNATYTWSSDDQVVIGDTSPKIHGNIGLTAGYKGWTLNLSARYNAGGDIYNTTLIDRVEDVTGYGNLDKRVSETWTNPGDHTAYRAISMMDNPNLFQTNMVTKPTSRFVQRNNELYVSSVNLGYEFFNSAWLRRAGIERLKITFYADELARLSTIKIERGLTYPFARNFSLSASVTF